jgi:hypothetical protein
MRFFVANGAPQNDGRFFGGANNRAGASRWGRRWRGLLRKSGGRATALQKFLAEGRLLGLDGARCKSSWRGEI